MVTATQSVATGVTATPRSYPPVAGTVPGGATDLLPNGGAEPSGQDLEDAMSAMYELLLADQNAAAQQGRSQVQCDEQERQYALQQQKQQLQREAHDSSGRGFFSCIGKLLDDVASDVVECHFDRVVGDLGSDVSACDNPKFWSDLEVGAKIVAAVAAAAATVCTAGAAGPIVVGVAVALSAAGFAVQETRCLGDASAWVGAGLQLAGAAVSCGGTLLASGAAAATSASVAQTAGSAANTASAGAAVVSGAAHIATTGYEADALDAAASAQQAKQAASFADQIEQWALDALEQQLQSHRGAMTALSDAMQTDQRASLLAAGSLSRG